MVKKNLRIAVVVPAFNEEKYLNEFIKELLFNVRKIDKIKKIFIIDDGSVDRTSNILATWQKKSSQIVVCRHGKNLGKGAALRTGLSYVKKGNYDGVIFLDSDMQHEPKNLKTFVEKLKTSPAVLGYRNLSVHSPFLRRLGNQIAKFIIKKLFHVARKDLLCGYAAFRKDVFSRLNWHSNDYGVETEISTIIGKEKISFEEVNIENIYLDKNKGVNLIHAGLIFLRIPFWYFSREDMIIFLIILFSLGSYVLLAFRNPFNLRSLVPNLEPYPDSLYYATPAWNLIRGNGFNMKVFDWRANLIVPPLYSLYLIPFFYFFGDVRSFYFANIFLMFFSIIFFILLLRKIFKNNFLPIFLIIFLAVTSFYLFNLPSLLMAENITLFLLIVGLNLLLSQITNLRLFFLSFWGVLLWLTKLANLPLGIIFYLLTAVKIRREKNKSFLRRYLMLSVFSIIIFILYLLLSKIFFVQKDLGAVKSFSLEYFLPNLKLYLGNLLGRQTHYLWYQEKLVSPLVGWLAVVGFVAGLIKKGYRPISLQLFLFIVSLVFFMSFFYVQDGRYILVIVPAWYIFLGFLVASIQKYISQFMGVLFVFVLLAALLLINNFGYRQNEKMPVSLKKQISLNLKYSETPWNYIAVTKFNEFFNKKENKNSYLGTFLPPFFVNFYTNNKYTYLPIIEDQDFFSENNGFLSQMKITSINDYYRLLLKQNKKVFVSNYYAANLRHWQERFDNLKNDFKLILKQQSCFEVCNIYQLELRE